MIVLLNKTDLIGKSGKGAAEAMSVLQTKQNDLSDKQRLRQDTILARQNLIDFEQERNLDRMLKGEKAVPRHPENITQIQNLTADLEGLDAAIPILQRGVAEAQSAVEKAISKRPATVLPIVRHSKLVALEAVRKKTAELLPLAAELAAHQSIQEHLLGQNFKVSARDMHEADFNPKMLVDALFAQMPPRIRPTEEDLQQMSQQTDKLIEETIKTLKEVT